MTDFIVTPETLDIQLQVVAPYAVVLNTGDDAPILKAINPADFDDCEFLIKIHPELYREQRLSQEMSPNTAERYRLFLRSIDATLCEFRTLLRDLFLLYQPFEAPYPVLPFLAPMVGVDFNYDVPEEFARKEVANAVFLWKRKGTRDNIADWIGFISGFRTRLREYYKEVFRTNVYEQLHAVTPSTITNKGGPNYGTLPHLEETHVTNRWNGNEINLPFFNFGHKNNDNYGTHGFTQNPGKQKGFFHVAKHAEGWDDFLPFPGTERIIESISVGETQPGFLFRNHVGVLVDVTDDQVEGLWFGEPILNQFIDKIERILDILCLYGVVKHLIWRLVTNEDGGLCEQITFNVRPSFSEGWNDIEPLPPETLQTETVSCDAVLEECVLCLGDQWSLDIDNVACFTADAEGRLANFVLCTNDPTRVTNDAVMDSNGGPWLTWHYSRYWELQIGRFPSVFTDPNGPYSTFGVAGALTTGDIFQTYFPGTTLNSEVVLPPELTIGEQFIDPIIGTGTGQGREIDDEPISQFVFDTCLNGRFEDNILDFIEEWNNPFVDVEELFDDWNIPDIFDEDLELFDNWNIPALADELIYSDDWEFAGSFADVIEHLDEWNITDVFDDECIHIDDWEPTIPLTVPGPGMWLDGNNGPKANSPVGLWLDRFTTDNDAIQALPASQPDLDKNDVDFNDFGSVTFDGIDDHMLVADDVTLNNDEFSVLFVMRWSYPGVGICPLSKSTDETFTDGWGVVHQTGNVLRFFVDDINTNFVEASIPNDQATIVCLRYDQSRLEIVVNGGLIEADLYGGGVANSAKDLVVGGHNLGSGGIGGLFDGTIAEVIYYNRALDNTEKITLITYLGTKYNIPVDFTSPLVVESWDLAIPYSETPEVTEPFDEGIAYVEVPEVTEPFEFTQIYGDSIEAVDEWEVVSLPDVPVLEVFEDFEVTLPSTPVLEVFEDFDGDIPVVIEPWDLAIVYSDTPEVAETFEDVINYFEILSVTDPFEPLYTSYTPSTILVDEDWEVAADVSDPGTSEYTEDWEAPGVEDPGTVEYLEHWSATNETLVLAEPWVPTTFVVDSVGFTFFENWNAQYTPVLVDFENWNSEFTPTLVQAEPWEPTVFGSDSGSFQFTEPWVPTSFGTDSGSFEHFEDWET